MLNGFYKNKNVQWNRLTVGALTFGIILIFNQLCKFSPDFYETIYLNRLFQILRVVHDYTLGLLPIPSIYLVLALFLYYFFKGNMKSFRSFLLAVFSFLLWVINCFYLLWGFNYTQPSIYESLQMAPVQLDENYIKTALKRQTNIVEKLAVIENPELNLKTYEDQIRPLLETTIGNFGIPIIGRVRIRKLPAGSLLSIRTSGIYIPHALEGHLDGGLYYKQHPFTIAHEMSHGYGYTDESVCNFLAYLCLIESENIALKYSAELAYWRYLARQYRESNPDEWTLAYEQLSSELKADLEQIRVHINRYKDLMPVMKDKIYDSYLKSHGVEAGIKSYDMMIELIAAYKQKINS